MGRRTEEKSNRMNRVIKGSVVIYVKRNGRTPSAPKIISFTMTITKKYASKNVYHEREENIAAHLFSYN